MAAYTHDDTMYQEDMEDSEFYDAISVEGLVRLHAHRSMPRVLDSDSLCAAAILPINGRLDDG